MIETLSIRWANKLKSLNPEETASVDVMSFALQGLILNTVTTLSSLLIGFVTGHLIDTIIAIICFIGLRLVSGGFHLKSALSCYLLSTLVFVAIPFVEMNDQALFVVNCISLILLAIFAPSNIKEHIRVSERYFPLFKLLSVAVVLLNFFSLTSVVTVAFLIQACSTVTFKREVR